MLATCSGLSGGGGGLGDGLEDRVDRVVQRGCRQQSQLVSSGSSRGRRQTSFGRCSEEVVRSHGVEIVMKMRQDAATHIQDELEIAHHLELLLQGQGGVVEGQEDVRVVLEDDDLQHRGEWLALVVAALDDGQRGPPVDGLFLVEVGGLDGHVDHAVDLTAQLRSGVVGVLGDGRAVVVLGNRGHAALALRLLPRLHVVPLQRVLPGRGHRSVQGAAFLLLLLGLGGGELLLDGVGRAGVGDVLDLLLVHHHDPLVIESFLQLLGQQDERLQHALVAEGDAVGEVLALGGLVVPDDREVDHRRVHRWRFLGAVAVIVVVVAVARE